MNKAPRQQANPEDDTDKSNKRTVKDALDAYLNSLREDRRDRFLAIIYTVDIEKRLNQLIECFLIDDRKKVKELLEEEKFLGNFGGKIQLAYCLGLISKEEFHNLNLIRKIRNKFAHEPSGLTFRNEQITNLCKNLQLTSRLLFHPVDFDEMFFGSTLILRECLKLRISKIKNRCVIATELEETKFNKIIKSWQMDE
jgi:DNA-binding MltR family transcriptional regulator